MARTLHGLVYGVEFSYVDILWYIHGWLRSAVAMNDIFHHDQCPQIQSRSVYAPYQIPDVFVHIMDVYSGG